MTKCKSWTQLASGLTVVLLTAVPAAAYTEGHQDEATGEAIPREPEYSDTTQWYISQRGAEADVFYIISTETGDYTTVSGQPCHFADTYADSLRTPMLGEMAGVDTLLSPRLNYYSPYYRQCSLQTFMSDSTLEARLPMATDDVKRAFGYYLQHLNGGRPFVLAGFSQGAIIMLELLSQMDDATYSRMIAAYAIGVAISQSQLEANPRIVPAKGATDTGVTISYNSVHTPDCAMPGWESSAVAINPVNWRTDGTEATLITEPTPLKPLDQQTPDTMTVRLDTATGLLLVSGYDTTDYQLPLIGREGNYHSREIWLYRQQLCQNIEQRAAYKAAAR